jgi:hypothetical protein
LTFHPWRGSLRTQELRLQIRIQNRVPLLVGELLEGRVEKSPGIVHEKVEPAELSLYGGEQTLHFAAAGDIGLKREAAMACGGDFRRSLLGSSRRAIVIHSDVCALARQSQSNRAPDALPGPGNQGDLAV